MKSSIRSWGGHDGYEVQTAGRNFANHEEVDVETQDQLLAELKLRGVTSTQATISRDIKELHLVKELTSYGTYKYVVSGRRASLNFAGRLRTIFKEGVTSFDRAQNIVVIKTMPGLASARKSRRG